MKTIKQIADEIGVTRQAVHLKIQKEPLSSDLEPHLTKKGKVLYIESAGVKLIVAEFLSSASSKNVKQMSSVSSEFDNVFLLFKEQLKEKDRQIAVKDEQLTAKDKQITLLIEQNTALVEQLDTSQRLHAGTLQQQLIGSSADELPTDEPTDDKPEPEKEEKRGFFGLFRRKS
jgi:predicted transcriptional regulator